jgi:two-component system chemotaxis response regulator CheY
MAHTILVADQLDDERSRILALLSEVGYHVIGASAFKQAARLATSISSALLIAEWHMGSYNGLGLLNRKPIGSPRWIGLMIAPSEPGQSVRNEAKDLGATAFLVRPLDPTELVEEVTRALAATELRGPARTSLTPGLSAEIASQQARVVDVTDDGLRLEMREPLRVPLPASLEVTLPTLQLSLTATTVWARRTMPSVFWFGMKLAQQGSSEAHKWRRIVHALRTSS